MGYLTQKGRFTISKTQFHNSQIECESSMIEWIAVLFLVTSDPIILNNIKYESEEDCWAHTTELVLDLNRSATIEFDSPPFKCRPLHLPSLQEMLKQNSDLDGATRPPSPTLDKE